MDEPMVALRRLGLTEWGARAYQALVGLGQTDATAVAEAAHIPRTRVYAILDELVDKGWATCDNTRPKTYRAERPSTCFERERTELLITLRHAEDHLEALYRQDGVRFGGPMWTLAGAEAIQHRLTAMVRAARHTLFLALPFAVPGDDRLFDEVREAVRRGVHVRILTADPHLFPDTKAPLGEVRFGFVPARILFMDDKQACITFRHPRGDDGTPHFKAIWNPHADMVEQMQDIVIALWEQAASGRTFPAAAADR